MKRVVMAVVGLGVVAGLAGAVLGTVPAHAQPAAGAPAAGGPEDPDAPPKNLKVLPKEMARKDVTALMKTFNKALGVKCSFCHNTKDYASDEKKHKDIARSFMRMTLEMEKNTFNYDGAPKVRFNCYMCHRGQEEPVLNPP